MSNHVPPYLNKLKLSKNEKKTAKKVHKKVINFLKDVDNKIEISDTPTHHLFIGNGGMLCGVTREDILIQFGRFGAVSEIIMMPQKSFSFLSYRSIEASTKAMLSLNGFVFATNFITPPAPLYLKYLYNTLNNLSTDSNYASEVKNRFVNGLLLKEEFITREYEAELVKYFKDIFDEQKTVTGNSLRHRNVIHFGYEFLYGTNNVDPSKPLEQKIPIICKPLLEQMLQEQHINVVPDQLTVTHYEPGQGIPPHVDTHSAFEDGIISLSLNSNVCMDFTGPNNFTIPVVLPRRSLLVMKGESRYLWTHGITPRKHDIVFAKTHEKSDVDLEYNSDAQQHSDTGEEHLTLRKRDLRISLTFRKVLLGPCRCGYPLKCDSQEKEATNRMSKTSLQVPNSTSEANSLEGEHVYQVYEEIASHFSSTRHSPWPKVKHFLCNLPHGSMIADVGCGNGKYLGVSNNIVALGSDRSFNLAHICRERNFEVLVADCLKTPYRSDLFDACVCIAVIHHLSTEERRLDALKEIVRITRCGGFILVYVWAIEQNVEDIKLSEEDSSSKTVQRLNDSKHNKNDEISDKKNSIEVSEGRYRFQQQDLLVPWHLKDGKTECDDTEGEEKVYHRFYHVFKQGELKELCLQLSKVTICDIYFDCGNWCVVLQKDV